MVAQVSAYVLNFAGRVTQPSVKNLQLVPPDDVDALPVLQFGRIGKVSDYVTTTTRHAHVPPTRSPRSSSIASARWFTRHHW